MKESVTMSSNRSKQQKMCMANMGCKTLHYAYSLLQRYT